MGNLNLVSRGKVTIKGKGQMHTYWLLPDGVTLEEETRIKRTVSFVDEVADAVAVDMDAISVIDEASRRASEAAPWIGLRVLQRRRLHDAYRSWFPKGTFDGKLGHQLKPANGDCRRKQRHEQPCLTQQSSCNMV